MAKWLSYLNSGGAASHGHGTLTLPKRKLTPFPTPGALAARLSLTFEPGAREKKINGYYLATVARLVPRHDPLIDQKKGRGEQDRARDCLLR